jgi:hypothetical protein
MPDRRSHHAHSGQRLACTDITSGSEARRPTAVPTTRTPASGSPAPTSPVAANAPTLDRRSHHAHSGQRLACTDITSGSELPDARPPLRHAYSGRRLVCTDITSGSECPDARPPFPPRASPPTARSQPTSRGSECPDARPPFFPPGTSQPAARPHRRHQWHRVPRRSTAVPTARAACPERGPIAPSVWRRVRSHRATGRDARDVLPPARRNRARAAPTAHEVATRPAGRRVAWHRQAPRGSSDRSSPPSDAGRADSDKTNESVRQLDRPAAPIASDLLPGEVRDRANAPTANPKRHQN